MPILKNAKKAFRVSQHRALANLPIKSRVKTSLDKFKKNPSLSLLSEVFSSLDRAVKAKIFHKNKVARIKSSVSKMLKASLT